MHIVGDLGGTTGRFWLCRSLDITRPIAERTFEMSKSGDLHADLNSLEAVLKDLIARGPVQAISIAIAGKLSEERTHIIAAGNLGHWVGTHLPYWIRDALGVDIPVYLCNDVEAIGMAEAYLGACPTGDFMACGWGTGFGMSFMRWVHGRLVPHAGEGGHQQIVPEWSNAWPCGCGGHGHVESYVGEAGILRCYKRPAPELHPFEWEQLLEYVEVGVRNALCVQPVPTVIFGGGVSCKQRWLLPRLEALLGKRLNVVETPRVRLATGAEEAGLLGALAYIRHAQTQQGPIFVPHA